jgi:hypothetical protein
MARFNTNTFRSLNESIARIQNPQAALDEAMEYTSILETVILDLCEALDLDPQALVEDALTADRGREWDTATSRAREDLARAKAANKKKSSNTNLAKVRKAQDRLRDVGYKRSDEEQSNKIYHRGGKVVGTRGEDRYEDR